VWFDSPMVHKVRLEVPLGDEGEVAARMGAMVRAIVCLNNFIAGTTYVRAHVSLQIP